MQPLVETSDARQEVENALVEAERTSDKRLRWKQVDELPMTKCMTRAKARSSALQEAW